MYGCTGEDFPCHPQKTCSLDPEVTLWSLLGAPPPRPPPVLFFRTLSCMCKKFVPERVKLFASINDFNIRTVDS